MADAHGRVRASSSISEKDLVMQHSRFTNSYWFVKLLSSLYNINQMSASSCLSAYMILSCMIKLHFKLNGMVLVCAYEKQNPVTCRQEAPTLGLTLASSRFWGICAICFNKS